MLILIEDDIVIDVVSTNDIEEYLERGYIEVPCNTDVTLDSNIKHYNKDYMLKSLQEIVNQGDYEFAKQGPNDYYPEGTIMEKLENGHIVPKTEYDFYKEGLRELFIMERVCEKTKTIQLITNEDKSLDMGEITPEHHKDIKVEKYRQYRDFLLRRIDELTNMTLLWEGVSEEEKEEVKEFRLALLDVPQQEGFPLDAVFPEVPNVISKNVDMTHSIL